MAKPHPQSAAENGDVVITFAPAEQLYDQWPTPICIISDGPYGIGGYPGDERTASKLAAWYQPHILAWSRKATPETTLWFWNTELGWASVHPMLVKHGWEYRCCNIWDKGMSHAAGNTNTQTLRKFPVVTEVCVQYVKPAVFPTATGNISMQEWLRREWRRTGLPLRDANIACGVSNAATRKYLTGDSLWYFPPAEAFVKLAKYANTHGKPEGKPYFSVDGRKAIACREWAKLRAKFTCDVGVTNVWQHPQVSGPERIDGERTAMRYKFKCLHGSQKPLTLVERIIRSSTDEGDMVWEPFGGLCPGAVVCQKWKRRYRAAEVVPEFYEAACHRLETHISEIEAVAKARFQS